MCMRNAYSHGEQYRADIIVASVTAKLPALYVIHRFYVKEYIKYIVDSSTVNVMGKSHVTKYGLT